jgi:hypothetical protein
MSTGKLRISELSNEMAANMSGVEVARGEMYAFLREAQVALPETNDNLARAWKGLGEAMANGMPLHPAIRALVDSIAAAQRSIGDTIAELPALARAVQMHDIARHEAPRTNEGAWNVGS